MSETAGGSTARGLASGGPPMSSYACRRPRQRSFPACVPRLRAHARGYVRPAVSGAPWPAARTQVNAQVRRVLTEGGGGVGPTGRRRCSTKFFQSSRPNWRTKPMARALGQAPPLSARSCRLDNVRSFSLLFFFFFFFLFSF